MRIGIDLHVLGRQRTGTETYLENLVRQFTALESRHEFRLFTMDPGVARAGIVQHPKFRTVLVRRTPLPVQRFVLLPWSAVRERLDVLHVQRVVPLGMPLAGVRTVVTIHDIAQRAVPDCFGWTERFVLEPFVRLSALAADHIIVDTTFTRDELFRHYGIAEDKIAVVPLGVDDSMFRPQNGDAVDATRASLVERWGVRMPFVLAVATLEPRKNLDHLLRAFVRATRADVSHLVLVGRPGSAESHLRSLARELNMLDRVTFVGYVPRSQLPLLYAAATAFAFPSLYEGFGLPPLEAMACGTPVLAARASCLPEVLGEAAVLLDPRSIDEWAGALRHILEDAAWRQLLVAKGLRHVRRFDWRESARRTLEVYEKVGAS